MTSNWQSSLFKLAFNERMASVILPDFKRVREITQEIQENIVLLEFREVKHFLSGKLSKQMAEHFSHDYDLEPDQQKNVETCFVQAFSHVAEKYKSSLGSKEKLTADKRDKLLETINKDLRALGADFADIILSVKDRPIQPEDLAGASAASNLPDGKEFETLSKMIKRSLNIMDGSEYFEFVFGQSARLLAQETVYSFAKDTNGTIEHDVAELFNVMSQSYRQAEDAGSRNFITMSRPQLEEYRQRMENSLNRDLKTLAPFLAQLFLSARDEPIDRSQLKLGL